MEPVDAKEPGEQQLAPKTCRKHVPHTTNTVDYRSGQEGDKLRPETRRERKVTRTKVQRLVGTFDVLLEGEEKDAGLNTRGALMEQINPNNLLSTPPRSRQATQRSGSSSQLSPFEYQSRHGS